MCTGHGERIPNLKSLIGKLICIHKFIKKTYSGLIHVLEKLSLQMNFSRILNGLLFFSLLCLSNRGLRDMEQ